MRPSETFIPLAVPQVTGKEIEYLQECLDTNWLSYAGPHVSRFEEALAAAAGANHAVAVASGTAALHLALILAGVKPGDEVVMPGVSFVAPANACRYVGAWPTFTDVSPTDWQWDIDALERFLETSCRREGGSLVNTRTGRRLAALMPVHLLGGMADLDRVLRLAEAFDLPVVEDAAECLGASYKHRGIGAPAPNNAKLTRIVCTSFNGNKIITTGGGGAVLTNDEELARRARHLSTTAKADRIEFFHDELGYNYRLTNLAAAVGLAQLDALDDYAERKRTIAARYAEGLAAIPGVAPCPEPAGVRSTFWMYTALFPGDIRALITRLDELNVMARPLWMPLYRLPEFQHCFIDGNSVSEDLYRRAVSLPCSTSLTESDQKYVMKAIRYYFKL